MAGRMAGTFKRKSKGEVTFTLFNTVFMVLICFITLYPVWYIIVQSFNDGADAMMGGIYWVPRQFSLANYKAVFNNTAIVKAFAVTVLRTVIGTVVSVLFTAMVAYPLTKKNLKFRRFYLMLGVVTMFLSGGLIPYFLLLKNLHLVNSFWVYIIPTMFNFFNMIIFMNFFSEIPASLEESASLDGANEIVVFIRIILPLSTAVIATIALFNGVFHWNDYFMGVIYINDPELQPIQTFLYRIIAEAGSAQLKLHAPAGVASAVTATSIKYATMVVTTFPIICVYPFLQKYFVKGVMIGSVKG